MVRTLSATVVVLVATSVLFGIAIGAQFEDCGNHSIGQYTSVAVANCTNEEEKCPLHRGGNATITINFDTKQVVNKVQQSVHGVIASVPVPFPMDEDACANSGLTCPLSVGSHTYHYSLFVKKVYPKVSVHVKWELLNEKGEQIICVIIPAILK